MVHSVDLLGIGHQVLALKKVWRIATAGGTVGYQTLSLMGTAEF